MRGTTSAASTRRSAARPHPTSLLTLGGPGVQRRGDDRLQAADQGQRRAAYGHVQQDADVHAVDDEPVGEGDGGAPSRRPRPGSTPPRRARRGALGHPQRVVPERQALRLARRRSAAISASSAASRSGGYLSSAMICATSAVVRPSGKAAQDLGRVLGGRAAGEARVEVGDQHVVGLEGLEAAGLEGDVLPLRELAGSAPCSARGRRCWRACPGTRSGSRPPCGPRRGRARTAASVSGSWRGRDDRVGVDAGHPGDRVAQLRRSPRGTRVVVNCANCSARKTAYSRSGASRRVATTTRHIGHVPWTRSRGSVANGIPRSRKLRYPRAWPRAV